ELSEMEKSVLRRYLNGENYSEIAQVLGKSPKSIDNTLQRIKKKVRLLAEKV
ncbi:MAG: LuxR C-terminal-related transcriptional regulator, partial [Clostridiales bacterium]|nr:LuxR C-terminal-related transcriptional regulator [Clostridiales bacterium]